MLVRAVYRGVHFHKPVPPGTATIEIEVFEPSRDPKTISVPSLAIAFQPKDSTLVVGEEFTIENRSTPPKAYFRTEGDFEFQVPEKAELREAASWGPAGMPVTQVTIDRGGNRFAIAYPFQPGENGVRVAYQVPYDSNQATVRVKSPYAHARVFLLAPPSMQVTSAGFQPAGTEQGMNVYVREAVAAETAMEIGISGTAPAASAAPDDAGRSASSDTGPAVQAMPGRLDILKWPLVGGFIALFALGAFYLAKRPVPAAAAGPVADAPQMMAGKSVPKASPPTLDTLNHEVSASVEALKDAFFRLELRRQAGTISEEEYASERARIEKTLRGFIRG
jgi:hypothetical protein